MAEPVVIDARDAVLLRLEQRCDHFEAAERRARKAERFAEAEGAHKVVLWLVRAFKAEQDDPPPAFRP